MAPAKAASIPADKKRKADGSEKGTPAKSPADKKAKVTAEPPKAAAAPAKTVKAPATPAKSPATDTTPKTKQTPTKPTAKTSKVAEGASAVVAKSKAAVTRPTIPAKPAEEQAFPRGGASALTPLEYREVSDQAKQDVLFEQTETEATVNAKPKSKRRRAAEDDTKDGVKKVRTDETTYAEALSFKRLNVGMTMIGVIKEINDLDVAISLPDQLTGYVSITEISDYVTQQVEKAAGEDDDSDAEDVSVPELQELFTVGQTVSCAITALEHEAAPGSGDNAAKAAAGRKRIALSLKPATVNASLSASELIEGLMIAASVSSEEDHGYVVSFGIDGVSGFLLKKNAAGPLQVGQIVFGGISKMDSARRVATVTLEPSVLAKAVVPPTHAIGFDALKAGALVNTKVKTVLDDGLLLTMFGILEGTVNLFNVGVKISDPSADLAAAFKPGQKLRARVLYVDPIRKKIGLTLVPSLVQWTTHKFSEALDIGSIADFTVVRSEGSVGVVVEHSNAGLGFAHISRLSDKRVEKVETSFKVGSKHRGRVVGRDYLGGLLQISFQKSVLEQPFLRHEDIKVGTNIKGKVVRLTPGGVIVALAGTINGFCPKLHYADIALSQPEKMFKEGAIIKCQVLSVDVKNKRVILTHKKSLLNSTLPKIVSYDTTKSGDIGHGVISAVKSFGCIVTFYNEVRALVPMNELSDKFVESAAELFSVGQPVKCRIIEVNAAEEKMRGSFNLVAKKTHTSAELDKVTIGELVAGTVVGLLTTGAIVELKPSLVRALIPQAHLSDDLSSAEKAHTELKEKHAFKELLVIAIDTRKGNVTISAKPSLLADRKSRAEALTIDDLEPGMILPAFVRNATEKAAYVACAGDVSGIVRIHNISDRFVSNAADYLKPGQSVKAAVVNVDKNERKVEFTLKQSVCEPIKEKPVAARPSLAEYTLGARVNAKIVSVKDTQINVELAPKVKGRVHVTQLVDNISELKDPKHPLGAYKVGETIECKVIGFHDAKTFRSLPFSFTKSPGSTVVELTMKPSELALPDNSVSKQAEAPDTLDTLSPGKAFLGFVQSLSDEELWVHIGYNLLGRAQLLDCPNPAALRKPHKYFPAGAAVECWVAFANPEKKTLDLTLREPSIGSLIGTAFTEGQLIVGRIKKVDKVHGLVVQVTPSVQGRVHLADISDEFEKDPTVAYRPGNVVRVCVTHFDSEKHRLDLSMRDSRVEGSDSLIVDPEVRTVSDVVANSVVRGYISTVADSGVFVSLGRAVSARIKISDLSDAFIKNWKEVFVPGQLVTGRITGINSDKVEMSLKQSVVDPDLQAKTVTLDSLRKGRKLKGTVTGVKEFGVFVKLANSTLTGLCHKTQVSDTEVQNLDQIYSVGDAVKVIVLKVDRKEKKFSLGLKASYFDENDAVEEDEEAADEDAMDVDGAPEAGDVDEDLEEDDDNTDGEEATADAMDVDGQEADSDEEVDDEDVENIFGAFDEEDSDDGLEAGEGLEVGGFDWEGAAAAASDPSDSESDAEGDDKSSKKKTRRAKQRAKKEEEERIAQKEISLLNGDAPPEVAEDFERLLLGSPNSSYLWIKFMAFQLQMAEVQKARLVAERALKSIGFREEQEKMNVWVAFLNLENSFGTPETLQKVFERAIAMNEPKAVYLHLIRIYERTQKFEQAEQLYVIATKKFNKSSKVWTQLGLFQLKRGKVEDARKTLQRSLQSLAKRKHVKIICKFAQMEFRYGEPERGRTIFEGIMNNYPKRVDLWSVYLDMEIRNGDVALTRRLFERVIGHRFSSKKMKFFFKKFLDFEKKHGTPDSVDAVKQKAVAYVESL
ncbi:rRNA biogenesis protein rrp5 [Geranomyces variabilis]|uniref:rRNA biogenesis protein rrp5 n=1 Tax=Geranomyces variabilis TaxID=109894 RepID=A0AAD5XQZ4_9FUNG|nr:rRNA biogenesis protein rrp5 [Geranomyces variabilis]